LMRVKLKNIIKSKFSQILVIWSLSAFSYLIIFATGNVQHDYYQVLIIPILSLLLAYFTFQLWSTSRLILVKKNWLHVFLSVMSLNLFLIYYLKFIDFAKTQQHSFGELKSLVIIFLFLFLGIKMKKSRKVPNLIFFSMIFGLIINFYFCWQRVKGYYNINNPAIVSAGQKATQILPIEAKIIAPYQGDTAFLWQTQRTGWPIGFDIEGKIAKGATHYITVNYDDEARELATKYQTIIQEEDYLILDLTKKLE